MPAIIPDTPVTTPEEDELGRSVFANSIADLVLSAPAKSSLRIGVYGGWGEGKTSVLRLMERRLRAGGHSSVWIAPWATSTRDELLDDLLHKIAAEFQLDVKGLRRSKRSAEVTQQLRQVARSNLKLRLAEILVGASLEGHFHRAVESQTAAFFAQIRHLLAERKLVVFVDDVDRIRPDLVPQVLLTLREVLDYPNFYYVLALAPDIVEKGLRQVHEAWGNHKQFLEKIVELPLSLPRPSDQQWKDFIQKQAAKFPPSSLWRDDLSGYLPRNPRKAKLFFRFAASLERLLARFLEEEIDWRTLCLALLLVLDFPSEARALADDPEAIRDLEYGGFAELGNEEKSKGKKKRYENFAPEEGRSRFLELCEAIRARELFTRGSYSLREMLTLHESPPILTWKEFEVLLVGIRSKGIGVVAEWVGIEPALRHARAKAFVTILLKGRSNLLDAAAEADLEDDLKARLVDAREALDVLRSFMEARLPFGSDEWLGFFGQAAHWTHFDKPAYYAEVRVQERDLLALSIDWLAPDIQMGILAARRLRYEPPMQKRSKEFGALTEALRARLESNAVGAAVRSFEELEGLERFWGEKDDSPLKRLLFDPDSAFHTSPDARKALESLSQRAADGDHVVQRNFRTYFRILTYAAFEQGGSFPVRDSRTILQDADFVSRIWRAAVVKPLNPRTMGSLRDDRQNVIAAGISESALPLPAWWITLVEQLNDKDAETASSVDDEGQDSDDGLEE